MRDFRDAKVMARALRDALKTKSVETSHSESLELIAKVFGFDNWNVLATKIDSARDEANVSAVTPGGTTTLHCSFCRKSDREVRKLIAGPKVMICDTCVGLCDDILEDEDIFDLLAGDEDVAVLSAARLERAKLRAGHWRLTLAEIRRNMAAQRGSADPGRVTDPASAHFRTKTIDELLALEQRHERALRRFEEAERAAASSIHAPER